MTAELIAAARAESDRVTVIEAAIHAGCVADIARWEAARPGGQYTQHLPSAHREAAERVARDTTEGEDEE